MPRIVGYVRVSTEGQAEAGYSLAAQRHAITQYCAAHGWEVAAWYEDAGVSAHKETITARPAFATLLADAEAHQFDQIIVHKLDRFSRRLAVTLEALARLERVGVGFVSITENLDFASPIGKVALAMLGALAQYSSDNLSTETRKGLAEKKRQGLHIGAIPYGAIRTAGRLSVNPALAAILHELYTRMATSSDYEIAQAFNQRGIPTRFNGVAWSDTAVRFMRLTHGAWLLDQPEPWPSLYRAARDRPTRPRVSGTATVHLTSGILKCRCGGWIRFNSAKGQTKYGTCIQHGRVHTRCPRWKGLTITRCETVIRAWLLALPDPALAAARPVENGDARRVALDERRRRVARLYADGLLTDTEYQAERVRLAADEARLPASRQQLVALGTRFAAVRHVWDDMPEEDQNLFLRQLLTGVEVGDGEVIPRLRPEWAVLWPDQPCGEYAQSK